MRHDIKQYNPAKPHQWEYKNQVLSGVSGFSYDFDNFAGDQSNTYPDDAPDLGVSGNIVARLTETVPRHVNHKIFFDNWFNSPNLQHFCKSGKAVYRKRGRPSNAAGNHNRDGTPLGFASRGSPAMTNPDTSTQPKKLRKRGRPQDKPLASDENMLFMGFLLEEISPEQQAQTAGISEAALTRILEGFANTKRFIKVHKH
ncbi:hypothetical protein EVAR_30878_1 [Eumeta japonica]|uniref:PiggyBac transposable element-derived protein domain-containing protein n=1 Tax=Eumeta variegata TaxID=151549 RepID=A0A4C1V431_EUMVA|nr:hypothetical protein EVAR_30878_1 [Eumeta japonica]